MAKKTILVFGSQIEECDALPLKLMPSLQKDFPQIEFIECDPNEEIAKFGKKLTILDTVQGIGKVELIIGLNQLEKIQIEKKVSMHDFDLAFLLKLLKKMKLLEEITIIGIPIEYAKEKNGMEKAKKEVEKIIEKLAGRKEN
jgi:Ni,Fe-hydrogenase maturation factor